MKEGTLEIDCRRLPMLIKLNGDHGNYVLFTLKAAGRKLDAQLTKLDRSMLKLLEKD